MLINDQHFAKHSNNLSLESQVSTNVLGARIFTTELISILNLLITKTRYHYIYFCKNIKEVRKYKIFILYLFKFTNII